MLELPALFLIHIPEAQDHLIGREHRIVQRADIDPAVFRAKPALVIPAIIGNALCNPFPDALQRKAPREGLIGAGAHNGFHRLEHQRIRALGRQFMLDIRVHLDAFVHAFPKIDAVNPIKGIAQHMRRVVRATRGAALHHIADGQICQHREQQHRDARHQIHH